MTRRVRFLIIALFLRENNNVVGRYIMDPIKPIKLIPKVFQTELPETKVDRNLPRITQLIKLPSGKWQFNNNRITINGQDMGTLLEQTNLQPAAYWSQLAADLNEFLNQQLRRHSRKKKKKVGKKEVEVDELDEELDPTNELGKLSALVEAYISKIMRLLKRKYDEKTDGLTYTLDTDGQLILNGMNVTSFVEMASRYPSDKARLFLQGLKTRLSVILSNKSHNPNYEKIYDATFKIFSAIDTEIKRIVEKDRLLPYKTGHGK